MRERLQTTGPASFAPYCGKTLDGSNESGIRSDDLQLRTVALKHIVASAGREYSCNVRAGTEVLAEDVSKPLRMVAPMHHGTCKCSLAVPERHNRSAKASRHSRHSWRSQAHARVLHAARALAPTAGEVSGRCVRLAQLDPLRVSSLHF